MTAKTPQSEPSLLVKDSPYLMRIWEGNYLPHHEIERRALGAQRLKERLSSIPWYAAKAGRDPDFSHHFYTGGVKE